MFTDRVASLGQRRRCCDAVGVRSHAGDQRSIGIVDVELDTGDGRISHAVRLD